MQRNFIIIYRGYLKNPKRWLADFCSLAAWFFGTKLVARRSLFGTRASFEWQLWNLNEQFMGLLATLLEGCPSRRSFIFFACTVGSCPPPWRLLDSPLALVSQFISFFSFTKLNKELFFTPCRPYPCPAPLIYSNPLWFFASFCRRLLCNSFGYRARHYAAYYYYIFIVLVFFNNQLTWLEHFSLPVLPTPTRTHACKKSFVLFTHSPLYNAHPQPPTPTPGHLQWFSVLYLFRDINLTHLARNLSRN